MKTLIRFTFREKMFNLTTVIINLILFTVIGVSVFADILFLDSTETATVNLDYSTRYLYPYLSQSSSVIYQISEKADNPVLHYDGGYELYLTGKGKDISGEIEEDLKKALKQTYSEKGDILTREYLKELEEIENVRIRQVSGDQTDTVLTLTGAVMYFLLSAFAALMANDINYDRNTGNLELILSCLKPREYLISRLIGSWLPLMIQSGLAVLYMTAFIAARMFYDGFEGMRNLLAVNAEIKLPGIVPIVMTAIIMTGVMLAIQFLMTGVALRERKSSEYGQKLVLFQAVLLCTHYLILHFSREIMQMDMFKFVPFVNALRECTLLLEGSGTLISCLTVMAETVLIILLEFRLIENCCFRKIGE